MSAYVTVFSVADRNIETYAFVGIGIAATLGGLLAGSSGRRGRDRKLARLGAAISILSALWVMVAVTGTLSRAASLKAALNSSGAQVSEGRVEDFQPMRGGCHSDESFTVAGQRFSYRDCYVTGAFNHTGGPIYPDEQVRVTHLGNAILKLEVASSGQPLN